jgi:hypothetical protein
MQFSVADATEQFRTDWNAAEPKLVCDDCANALLDENAETAIDAANSCEKIRDDMDIPQLTQRNR